jgi:hypothetical protein
MSVFDIVFDQVLLSNYSLIEYLSSTVFLSGIFRILLNKSLLTNTEKNFEKIRGSLSTDDLNKRERKFLSLVKSEQQINRTVNQTGFIAGILTSPEADILSLFLREKKGKSWI